MYYAQWQAFLKYPITLAWDLQTRLPLTLLMYSLDPKSYCDPNPLSSHEVMLHDNRSQKLSFLSTMFIHLLCSSVLVDVLILS